MSEGGEPVLSISDLGIIRGDRWLLSNINWSVFQEQNWVILGPNGSGKSSLLSTLTGYLQATHGDIHVLGELYGGYDWREMRKRIGFVGSSLQKLMVQEELAIEIIAGGKEAQMDCRFEDLSLDLIKSARSLLKKLAISKLEFSPWSVLSQGERQRVLIGRALMAQPAVLILDEPCAGLDPVSREKFLLFLGRLTQKRLSPPIVLVTHHVEEIRPFFTHALMLNKGRCIAQGPIGKTLNTKNVQKTFGNSALLKKNPNGYSMSVSFSGHQVA